MNITKSLTESIKGKVCCDLCISYVNSFVEIDIGWPDDKPSKSHICLECKSKIESAEISRTHHEDLAKR